MQIFKSLSLMKLFYDNRGVSVLRYFKGKINQIFKKINFYVALIGIFFLILIVSILINVFVDLTLSYNFFVFSIFLLMYAFIIQSLFKINPEHLKTPKNIYEWLDIPILYNQDKFLNETKKKKINKGDLMENLDYFRKQLLTYTKHDLTKLRMLKAYVRAKNSKGNFATIMQTLIALISGPLFVFILRQEAIINYYSIPEANPLMNSVMTYILIFLLFVFVLINLIFLFSGNKKRLFFIEEMVEVCIKEIEEENNKSA
ncbi:hypothetical protein ACTHOS_01820 [Bacillus safensis]|uniref:hypothetical protein n=1 Tax=Bacillus safensis TaxID=561879 RepID=UPI003F7B5D31